MGESGEKNNGTRERLLRAAGEVFASRGFRAATVREISLRAKANVAAVNYHFRDKEGLYSEVLKYTLRTAQQNYPPDRGLASAATKEERLHAFIRSILSRIFDEGRPAWHGKLMAREIMEPTGALDQVVEDAIRPLHEYLRRIVAEFLGRKATNELIRFCTMSIMGQCVFFHHSRPVIERLHQVKLGTGDIEQLASHITRFSMAALSDMAKQGEAE
jgi:AcrR family transcriptional regulator